MNTMHNEPVKKLLLPTLGQSLICLLVSGACFAFVFKDLIISRLRADNQFAATVFSPETAEALSNSIKGDFLGRFSVVLFWVFLGILVLIIIWTIANTYIQIHNDVISVKDYPTHPLSDYARWPLLQALAGVVLVATIMLNSLVLMPWLFRVFGSALTAYKFNIIDWLIMLGCVIVLALSFCLLVVVFRLMTKIND